MVVVEIYDRKSDRCLRLWVHLLLARNRTHILKKLPFFLSLRSNTKPREETVDLVLLLLFVTKMLGDYDITEEDMVIDEAQGYPIAYAKICRDLDAFPYRNGPPFTFMPYILQQNEVIICSNHMFARSKVWSLYTLLLCCLS